jgi:large repetitive protein
MISLRGALLLGSWLALGCGPAVVVPICAANVTRLCFAELPLAAASVRGAAAGDFNGDSRIDLAVSSADGILLFLNNGSFAPFADSALVPLEGGADAIAGAALDGDGDADLIAASGDALLALLNDGAGGFAEVGRIPLGVAPSALVAEDLDGDGVSDAAATLPEGALVVLLGDGAGGLGAPSRFPVGREARSLSAGDFDGDQDPDLAAASFGSGDDAIAPPSVLTVRFNDGAGGFPDEEVRLAGAGAAAVDAGDIDLDGDPDLAAVDFVAGDVNLFTNRGGSFGAAGGVFVGGRPAGLVARDFDSDSDVDLAISDITRGVRILLNEETSFLGVRRWGIATVSAIEAGAMVAEDFDGDGLVDLAVLSPSQATASVLLSIE